MYRRKLAFGVWSVTLALVFATIGFIASPPKEVQAVTWGSWVYNYDPAYAFDCNMSREAAERFVGPIQYYPVSGCQMRTRERKSQVVEADGWDYRWYQLENDAPLWDAWGMRLQVQIRTKNGIAQVVSGTLTCSVHAFLVTVVKDTCEVTGSGTSTVTLKMSYRASWSYLFGNVVVERGAKVTVNGNNYPGIPVYWAG